MSEKGVLQGVIHLSSGLEDAKAGSGGPFITSPALSRNAVHLHNLYQTSLLTGPTCLDERFFINDDFSVINTPSKFGARRHPGYVGRRLFGEADEGSDSASAAEGPKLGEASCLRPSCTLRVTGLVVREYSTSTTPIA